MQGNWPIYQKHEKKTKLQSHGCIKNGFAGLEEEEKENGSAPSEAKEMDYWDEMIDTTLLLLF